MERQREKGRERKVDTGRGLSAFLCGNWGAGREKEGRREQLCDVNKWEKSL